VLKALREVKIPDWEAFEEEHGEAAIIAAFAAGRGPGHQR
jgi:hypothetical protein